MKTTILENEDLLEEKESLLAELGLKFDQVQNLTLGLSEDLGESQRVAEGLLAAKFSLEEKISGLEEKISGLEEENCGLGQRVGVLEEELRQTEVFEQDDVTDVIENTFRVEIIETENTVVPGLEKRASVQSEQVLREGERVLDSQGSDQVCGEAEMLVRSENLSVSGEISAGHEGPVSSVNENLISEAKTSKVTDPRIGMTVDGNSREENFRKKEEIEH